MPRPKKSLAERVRERSFVARRHGELLEIESLVADDDLRRLQEAYIACPNRYERRALALEFEKAVRQLER